MDIRKLEIFLNLAKTKNYSETAAQLFTTQGNISKQIISLEKELNVRLIDRSHRAIELTNSGMIVVEYAKKIVSSFEKMNRNLVKQNQTDENSLIINAVPSISNYLGLELITAFHKLYPKINLNLFEVEGNLIMNTLNSNKSSIVFTRDFNEIGKKFDAVKVEEDRFVCVLPADHPLAKEKTISLAKLVREDFLLLGRETLLYDRVVSLTKKVGFEPHVIYSGKQFKSIVNMIAKGMGISIVMEKSVDIPGDGTIITRPLDVSETSQMLFIRNSDIKPTKAVEMFWKFIESKQ